MQFYISIWPGSYWQNALPIQVALTGNEKEYRYLKHELIFEHLIESICNDMNGKVFYLPWLIQNAAKITSLNYSFYLSGRELI